jgi:hypothetical protein
MNKTNRRSFIKNVVTISGGLMIHNHVFSDNRSLNKDVLKGFIVSDAHFGWDSPVQPAPEKQIKMMEIILKQFPDLDMFIDTGDAHHNGNNRDVERGLWTDIIKNPSQPLPFYYVAGNHEIDHCSDTDPEARCNRMGSVSCRPYYSWDMKGIHFVSMPELVKTVFMNKEILEWVELDLELNKEKTTVLFSHNQLLNTTSGHEPGYRGILNSDELWSLMKKYPNVKAWMHGHNHNYEMVEKNGILFVSNGRIGGFDPSKEAHGLGGIYFEISKDQLIAKSYSAEKEKFLTKSDVNEKMHPQYHPNGMFLPEAELNFKTSLNGKALPAYSYGMGGANSGTRFPIAHHHAVGKGNSYIFIGNNQNPTLNNDPDFKYFIRSGRWGEKDKKTSYMGGNIRGNYEWLDPNGVKLLQTQKGSFAVIELPEQNFDKYCYYKVAPGTSYVASIRFANITGGQTVQIECKLHNQTGKEINRYKSDLWTLLKGETEKSFEVHLPKNTEKEEILSNEISDNELHLSFSFNINTSEGDVIVKRVSIEPLSGNGITKNPVVIIDGERREKTGELLSLCKFDIPNPANSHSVCEVYCEESKRLTWLVKHEGWDWQVRNASIRDYGNSLEFSELRNTWTHKKEVVFVPASRLKESYVFKIRNASNAKVFPLNRGNQKLHFTIEKLVEGKDFAEVEIMNLGNKKVKGAEIIESVGNKSILKVLAGETVYIS